MIELENVTKVYQSGGFLKKTKSTKAVRNLNLAIAPGAFGLLGVNGAGKTTTLKMMATLLWPTGGRVRIDGLDTVRDQKALRARLNMVTGSDRMLYFRLTGRENLLYFAALYGLPAKEARRRAGELIDLVGLGAAADQRVEQYSRGMKQRLGIARGLINNPQYLFLDEPTLGLDVQIACEIRNFIKDHLVAAAGKTVVLTSHYMTEIEQICETIGILSRGELIFTGTFKELYRDLGLLPVHRFLIKQEGPLCADMLRGLIERECSLERTPADEWCLKVRTQDEIAADVFHRLSAAGLKQVNYQMEKAGLEEALLLLSKREEGSCCGSAVQ